MKLGNFIVDVNNDFRMEKTPMAQGNFGEVFEGWRKKDNFHVAIKKLKSTTLELDEQVSLVRELNLLANLKHPNCLQLTGFQIEPHVYIITPFMPNGSLESALTKCFDKSKGYKDFTPTKKMCSIYGICSTMSYIHSKDIIHRDFKPENIFLDDNYEICIADFGLSRIVQENIQLTRGMIGSPIYMAPDIYSDDETYTNAVDVYSFGVTLYHYFCPSLLNLDDTKGKIKSQNDFLRRILKGSRLVKDPRIPDEYYEIYRNCAEQNPDLRPSFSDLADRFEKDRTLLLDGVNEIEYHEYIEKCKKIIEDLNKSSTEPEKIPSPPKKVKKIYL